MTGPPLDAPFLWPRPYTRSGLPRDQSTGLRARPRTGASRGTQASWMRSACHQGSQRGQVGGSRAGRRLLPWAGSPGGPATSSLQRQLWLGSETLAPSGHRRLCRLPFRSLVGSWPCFHGALGVHEPWGQWLPEREAFSGLDAAPVCPPAGAGEGPLPTEGQNQAGRPQQGSPPPFCRCGSSRGQGSPRGPPPHPIL